MERKTSVSEKMGCWHVDFGRFTHFSRASSKLRGLSLDLRVRLLVIEFIICLHANLWASSGCVEFKIREVDVG